TILAKPNGTDRVLRRVVKGMLPKNKLGAHILDNLYVYAGSEHPHVAQQPKAIDINQYK
ncbi:MAG: uL13 family ribosomal protein, partial [Alloprevotella sp.]|nr:uL13 family ribosomal protein [Alloprevotella sp.]